MPKISLSKVNIKLLNKLIKYPDINSNGSINFYAPQTGGVLTGGVLLLDMGMEISLNSGVGLLLKPTTHLMRFGGLMILDDFMIGKHQQKLLITFYNTSKIRTSFKQNELICTGYLVNTKSAIIEFIE